MERWKRTIPAIKVVVRGRTFLVNPCPECRQAEVRLDADGHAYGVCPCCDGRGEFPLEYVREYRGGCAVCGADISRSVSMSMCPNCAAIKEH